MRIAYLSDYSPENINVWSGTPYHVYHALKKVHDVKVVGIGILDGIKWHHRILGTRSVFHPEYYCREIGQILSDEINKGDYDIVLTCTYHFCVALNINIPIVYYSDVTFKLYQDFFKNKDLDYHKVAIATEYACLHKANAVIYSSAWARNNAISEYNLPPENVHVIEFGANIPEPVNNSIKNKETETCNLVFVGRNWKQKGGNIALHAYHILQEIGFKCTLTIIGCTPEEQISDKNIHIIPWIDKSNESDLKSYEAILRRSHFLILPTRFDAFGIVFCEAAAYGVPSIAPNICGVTQPIINGKNGYLLPKNANAYDYANIIKDVFSNTTLYNNLRASTLNEYKNRLNWDLWCTRFTSIAKELTCDKFANLSYIPVYAINLPHRKDRRKHLEKQFEGRPEFHVTYVEAETNMPGNIGLWHSINKAVKKAIQNDDDLIIICEDDHVFTENYRRDLFFKNIIEALTQGAELISAGIGGFGDAVFVSNNRLWVNWFYSTQFIVLTSNVYQRIIDYNFDKCDTADGVLSKIISNKQVLFPFMSIQKDFGYSDVTESNNKNNGLVEHLFHKSTIRLIRMWNMYKKYLKTNV